MISHQTKKKQPKEYYKGEEENLSTGSRTGPLISEGEVGFLKRGKKNGWDRGNVVQQGKKGRGVGTAILGGGREHPPDQRTSIRQEEAEYTQCLKKEGPLASST